MVPFFTRAADYYRHPIGEVIRTALPTGLSGRGESVSILREKGYAATFDDAVFHPAKPTKSYSTFMDAALVKAKRTGDSVFRPRRVLW